MKKVDAITRKWVRNKSDELAVANGCRFSLKWAKDARDWIQEYCYLYEGEFAGQPMELRDWQLEAVMRIFGWCRYSKEWSRDVRRFHKASIWVPKKNGKSPTLAAIGLYLLCGNGEQGQKIFSTARDGKQALISHTHALEMVRRSPALMRECSINKSTGRITHEASRSFYSVISGDNIEGQEGLNGSVLVDECHVVDARLMKVLKYAGISRAEPLHIEVSTAGNNPDGYGKMQCDHGAKVAKGDVIEEDFFYLHYGAPADLKDSDLDAAIVHYGKAANPTWGRMIREGEFVASYQSAKKSISDMADFKMYRLNIWQRAFNPWLKASDWEACRGKFKHEDLHGMSCVAGLDLSRVSDMSALVLMFRDPEDSEGVLMIPKFWLPEAYAKMNNHLAPFLEWAQQGWLRLSPGSTMDYGFLKADVRALADQYSINALIFDEMYAAEVVQAIADGTIDNTGKTLEAGIGCERVAFKQNLMTFAKPTEDFESLVVSHKLKHDGNPVMDWMAGHCEVYRDVNGNKRPIKPDGKKGGVKKIDGVISAVMALAKIMEDVQPNTPTITIF